MISKYKTSNLLRSKVDYFFLLVYCIFHSLPRSTVFVFYIKNHQVATVNHIPIPRLVCSFRMYIFIRVVHIDFVIVCSIALHIEIECLRRIWHTQSKSAVIISINSLCSLHGRSYDLVKVAIFANKKPTYSYRLKTASESSDPRKHIKKSDCPASDFRPLFTYHLTFS